MKLKILLKNKLLLSLLFAVLLIPYQKGFTQDRLDINNISKNLRCLICQGQSIYDSNSDFALSMRLFIQEKIENGSTEKEIYEVLTQKYGQWIVYDPGYSKKTIFLWLIPLLFFLLGGAIIYLKIYKSKKFIN
tara:strand:+ start:9227 stop:9625 length:399 start_codon:yes stop_codon:yes gene_type:complete